MDSSEIRKRYLEFFQKRGHAVLPSASLVPENDPTTLFTGSGMQPLLPYFLGAEHPSGKRVADSQKSFRAQDIEEVGDNRHTTFFEMLGNWSFGDYFKREQIPWVFEFLTKELRLDPNRLYFTCYKGNDFLGIPKDVDSAEIWVEELQKVGIAALLGENPEEEGMKEGERIFYYGDSKNWWSRAGVPGNMPEGEPGGPDSEVFFDFGAELKLHEHSSFKNSPCHVNCDCGRFMEVGNSVFMEYVKRDGKFQKLPRPNVDFGGGLERLSAATLDNPDMFRVDSLAALISEMEKLSGRKYTEDKFSFRVIADHMRAAIFLIADGVSPSNTEKGYFVRRLIRRSVRFGEKLGLKAMSLSSMVEIAASVYGEVYSEIENNSENIKKTIDDEERRFRLTLVRGLKVFEEKGAAGEISGEGLFELFTTYGFPVEITEEMAKEKGIKVSRTDFEAAMKKHRELSRASLHKKFKGGLSGAGEMETKYHTATHLLHRGLREVLGTHVLQKGSNITPERLRFDFSHPAKLTPGEIDKVEAWVNESIAANHPVVREEMTLDKARELGAIGLFGEKYGEKVSVYKIGEGGKKSLEFCGGPHVERTGVLGKFKITKEEAVAAGVRRIRAILS